jgi:hypothetical protein
MNTTNTNKHESHNSETNPKERGDIFIQKK